MYSETKLRRKTSWLLLVLCFLNLTAHEHVAPKRIAFKFLFFTIYFYK